MRFFSWTMALFVLTCILSSCGGSAASTAPATVQATCDSGLLWAMSTKSGARIPDNDSTGITLNWNNQTCALQSVRSATLDICLNHSKPSDLVWTITSPASATAMDITAPSNWSLTNDVCDGGQRKLQRIDLLPILTASIQPKGSWSLNVKDLSASSEGYLIQWHVNIQGLQ